VLAAVLGAAVQTVSGEVVVFCLESVHLVDFLGDDLAVADPLQVALHFGDLLVSQADLVLEERVVLVEVDGQVLVTVVISFVNLQLRFYR